MLGINVGMFKSLAFLLRIIMTHDAVYGTVTNTMKQSILFSLTYMIMQMEVWASQTAFRYIEAKERAGGSGVPIVLINALRQTTVLGSQ